MTPLWFAKHQYQVPALFLAFFNISASGTTESDDQIKTDINALRAALTRSGFKPRFAAVLLSDKSILSVPQLEERLSSIRKATALDSKTGLFFMPPMSSNGEIATFVHSIMVALQPSCMEYYRDLTKHARRKKAKAGSASPSIPVGFDIQPLPSHGWYIRYEVKQGVFAEFRQEMDIAERHYSTAIDDMFHPEGAFETLSATSPRWDEARLLCDALALRVVRCQLWNAQTTGAVQSWMNYKARVKALVERKGKGLQTYSWSAWESRWAEIMAQLVQRANLQPFQLLVPQSQDAEAEPPPMLQIFLAPEKSFAAVERLPPLQSLHHPGYWLKLASKHFRSRLQKALAIPETDQIPSDQSPASSIAVRNADYDLYLVPAPDQESRLARTIGNPEEEKQSYAHMLNISQRSIEQFLKRDQTRLSDSITLDLARDLMDYRRHEEALQLLQPLWEATTWRTEEWHYLFVDLLLAIRTCAEQLHNPELILTTEYELISIHAPMRSDLPSLQANLASSHLQLSEDQGPMSLSFKDHQRLCPVSLSFGFKDPETHVGDGLDCQLVVIANVDLASASLAIYSITIRLDNARSITLTHSAESTTSHERFSTLSPPEDNTAENLAFHDNLELQPNLKRILSFKLSFREAASVRLEDASILFKGEGVSIEHTFNEKTICKADVFYVTDEGRSIEALSMSHSDTTAVTVLPKPPKVELAVAEPQKTFYVGEPIRVWIVVSNEEADTIEGTVSVVSTNSSEDSQPLAWSICKDEDSLKIESDDAKQDSTTQNVPTVAVAETRRLVLFAKPVDEPVTAEVQVSMDYNLVSDKSTTLRKSLTVSVDIVMSFDARFNFGPLLYQGDWPSYFTCESDQEQGIPQLWRLGCQLQCSASEDLVVHEIKPLIDEVTGDSAAIAKSAHLEEDQVFSPGKSERYTLELSTTKHSLDDRRPTTVDCSLAVTWSRKESRQAATTYLPIPRLTLPVSEPRVLCTVAESESDDEWDGVVRYHIENPSTHFLTFAVSMEATEQFAFSGPKARALSLAPLSRYKLEYHIALQEAAEVQSSPEDDGPWIWPALQVTDSYYQKTLRVHPGGPRVRLDDKQNIGVLIKKQQE